MDKIKKILIANRGEIALRVIRTCRILNIQTVSVYLESEASYPHVKASDESFCLGNGTLGETYLNSDLILKIAQDSQVDAIHPGYGFLSENANFSKAVSAAGLIFIGPGPANIELMGDKISSKVEMEKHNIPLIPGYHGSDQNEQNLLKEAKKIGFPLLIKATAGGGGKGMKISQSEKDFFETLASAKSEAGKAFGNEDVLLEKLILKPRHIEVQVFSDQHGQHFHFYERECSIQRRHQKIIEETPSPALTPQLREEICQTGARVAASIDYVGAGTVEFILDESGKFYFLEMNTRLQVEHPISECLTGFDFVEIQIRVAAGEKLPFKQSDITSRGHALECRIYAEDPDNNFLPTVGKIIDVGTCHLPQVRHDCGYENGNEVTVDFDPMLSKLITYTHDRKNSIETMKKALDDYSFLGIKTNRDYLKRILGHQEFVAGQTYTNFVTLHEAELKKSTLSKEDLAHIIVAYYDNKKTATGQQPLDEWRETTAWDELSSFRNV